MARVLVGIIVLILVVSLGGPVLSRSLASFLLLQDLKEAVPLLDESVEVYPALCDTAGLSDAADDGLHLRDIPPGARPCYHLHQASLLCLAGNLDFARDALDQAAGCPRPELLRLVSGDVAYARGNWAQARDEWSASPDMVPALLGRAKVLLELERDTQAQELLQELAGNEGAMTQHEAWQVYETLGRIARKRGDAAQIEAAYSRALAFAPDRVDYLVWIGIAQRDQGDLSSSYASLDLAAQMWDPKLCEGVTWARAQLALSQEALGDARGALDSFRDILDLAESNPKCSQPRVQWLRYHVQRLESLVQE